MLLFFLIPNNKTSITFPLAALLVSTIGISMLTAAMNEESFFPNVIAQEFSKSVTNSLNDTVFVTNDIDNNGMEQNTSKTVIASGHFANNQMKDGIVTWIQGGFWNLEIDNSSNIKNMENTNMSATFDASFTMIRPDGSLSHNHVVNNFTSTNVIFAGNDIVVTGVSDIDTDNEKEYSQVPLTIHLMGKKVLGLMIDVNKTGGHFSSSNEMYGTLISGIGLDNSASISNSTMNARMTTESQNTSNSNSVAHMAH